VPIAAALVALALAAPAVLAQATITGPKEVFEGGLIAVEVNCPPNHDRDIYFAQYCEYRDRDTSSLDPPPGRVAEFRITIVNAHGTPRQYAINLVDDMGMSVGGDSAWDVRTEGQRLDQPRVVALRAGTCPAGH